MSWHPLKFDTNGYLVTIETRHALNYISTFLFYQTLWQQFYTLMVPTSQRMDLIFYSYATLGIGFCVQTYYNVIVFWTLIYEVIDLLKIVPFYLSKRFTENYAVTVYVKVSRDCTEN